MTAFAKIAGERTRVNCDVAIAQHELSYMADWAQARIASLQNASARRLSRDFGELQPIWPTRWISRRARCAARRLRAATPRVPGEKTLGAPQLGRSGMRQQERFWIWRWRRQVELVVFRDCRILNSLFWPARNRIAIRKDVNPWFVSRQLRFVSVVVRDAQFSWLC